MNVRAGGVASGVARSRFGADRAARARAARRAASEMLGGADQAAVPITSPLYPGPSRYAVLGSAGFELPSYADMFSEGGDWRAGMLRRGTPDPQRSLVVVPTTTFANAAGAAVADRGRAAAAGRARRRDEARRGVHARADVRRRARRRRSGRCSAASGSASRAASGAATSRARCSSAADCAVPPRRRRRRQPGRAVAPLVADGRRGGAVLARPLRRARRRRTSSTTATPARKGWPTFETDAPARRRAQRRAARDRLRAAARRRLAVGRWARGSAC